MIVDYELIVSVADLVGRESRNEAGRHVLIANDLPVPEGMEYEDYFGIHFLDIETTGLSGLYGPLFLIGILEVGERGLSCTQLLAREPCEEPSVLRGLLDHLPHGACLMTFNGDSFDIPYIETRMNFCSLTMPEINSIDLLKPARKRYKDKLASCSLQSLERHVLKLPDYTREDDIPGYAIPRVYWECVNSGNLSLLLPVVKHNILDLISTARLWGILMKP